jgi:hypothetical protein
MQREIDMKSKETVVLPGQQEVDRYACTCVMVVGSAICILAVVFSLLVFSQILKTYPQNVAQVYPPTKTPPPTHPTITPPATTPTATASLAFGNYTLTLMEESCPTYPAEMHFEGWVSRSGDPLAPWSKISVHFKGTHECRRPEMIGGASLIYRYKLEFADTTQLASIAVSGAAFNGPNSLLRVLDEDMNILGSVNTFGGNTFHMFRINLEDIEGRIFYIDEFDTSPQWRFRSSIVIE